MSESIKDKSNTLLRFSKLLKSVNSSKNQRKVVENRSSLLSMLTRAFPILKTFKVKKLNRPKSGEMLLKQYVNIVHKKMNVLISYKDLKDIFKQVYPYLVRTLIVGNIAGGAAFITSVTGMFIIPIAAICAIAVMLNASTHGLSPQQATANFKRSFKEFMNRQAFTKKEKSFAFFPIMIVSLCYWMIKFGTDKTFWKSLSGLLNSDKLASELADQAKTSPENIKTVLGETTLKLGVIIFSVALIIFLFLTVIDQMILRKGESPSHEV